jgi:hypothetical protein
MRNQHSRIWLMVILCGVGLTWPLPLGGALLAVAASFGFVISWEAELGQAVMMTPSPAVVPPEAGRAACPEYSADEQRRRPARGAGAGSRRM